MNSNPLPPDPLLRALLDEAAPDDFRAATLAATLRGARRRRHLRQARAVSAALALPLLAAALLFIAPRRSASPHAHDSRTATDCSVRPPLPSDVVIRTRPAPELLVVTTPLAAGQLLASAPLERAARVRTDARLGPILIDDAELLALAPPASALVRLAPGRQRLIFGEDGKN